MEVRETLNNVSENNENLIIPEKLVGKIKRLNCPFLENKGDWWIQNILFSRPEYYNELLQWIESNFQESGCSSVPDQSIIKYILQGAKAEDVTCSAKENNFISIKINALDKLLDIYFLKVNMEKNLPVDSGAERSHDSYTKECYEDVMAQLDEVAGKCIAENFFPSNAPALHHEVEVALQSFAKKTIEKVNQETPIYENLIKKHSTLLNQLSGKQRMQKLCTMQDGEIKSYAEKPLSNERELQEIEGNMLSAKMSLLKLMHEFDDSHQHLRLLLPKQKIPNLTLGENFQTAFKKVQELTEALEKFCSIESSFSRIQSLKNDVDSISKEKCLPGFLNEEMEDMVLLLKKIKIEIQ